MKFSFLIFFYFTTAIVLIFSLLGIPLKFKLFRFFVILFTNNMVMALKVFGIKIKVINGHLANQKGCLFASKHQSMFETIYYNHLLILFFLYIDFLFVFYSSQSKRDLNFFKIEVVNLSLLEVLLILFFSYILSKIL